MPRALPTPFFDRDPVVVARELLGCEVALEVGDGGGRSLRRGRIVETEAYGGFDDQACHGHRGETPRIRSLFGPPGRALVYVTYGIHHMLNAVTCGTGEPFCVLLRALEPLKDVEADARGSTRGPGLLTKALGVDLNHDGGHLRTGPLRILEGGLRSRESVAVTTRVGVEGAGPEAAGQPWRFLVAGNPHVSRGRPSTAERAALVVAERAARRAARRSGC